MRKIIGGFNFLMLICAVCVAGAAAQETVFNVPAADILDKGKVYGEFDASFKTNNQEALRRFSSFVPRIVVGAGGNTEIGLNVLGNVQPGPDATILVPSVKYRFYQNEKKDLAIFAGNDFYLPVRNRAFKFGSYSYAAVAKTFNKTRVTGALTFIQKTSSRRMRRAAADNLPSNRPSIQN